MSRQPAKLPPKTVRYRAGKAPSFGEEDSDNDITPTLARSRISNVKKEQRVRHEAQVVTSIQSEPVRRNTSSRDMEMEDASLDEDRRRAAARARFLQQQADEDAMANATFGDGEDESGSDETDSDEESDSDDPHLHQLMKPVFVKKAERNTVHEQQAREEQENQRYEEESRKRLDRQDESRRLLLNVLQREELAEAKAGQESDSEAEGPADTDGDSEVEYKKWKVRELTRMKAEKDEREAFERERADTERRRRMTDAEREEENQRLGINQKSEKQQWNFLQRYYHKGAFFLDDETVHKARQVEDAPTLEDRIDKSALPEIMQRKNFGKSSQSKWTHLTKEDTSRKASERFVDAQVEAPLHAKMMQKMGGYGSNLERPSRKRGRT
eukprot:TRINITY_DN1085_c0_g1_i1.p1 TRINITY_DN1085_c0_g1~~TRINITY_DN1085_c0_g1_i1.p1  ORF type:complete len:384 (-),score=89.70 TRINITY_DN1085_c0_g1_i1:1763-2914(-)